MLKRATIHDMDKMTLYPFFEKDVASAYHRATAPHHIRNTIPKSYYDKVEAIIDYECAGYTKPDKPKNAYDTIHMFLEKGSISEEVGEELLSVCKDLGIASSYLVTEDKEGLEEMKKYDEVSEEMILAEIINYVSTEKTSSVVTNIIGNHF